MHGARATLRAITVAGLALLMGLHVTGPITAQDAAGGDGASVVVTTEVLGSVVTDLAGDSADIHVLMEHGADPHSWQPSARDSEAVFEADLVVANGLDLEEGLVSVLEQAESDGVPVFHAADQVSIRASAGAEDDHDEETDGGEEHGGGDPHFWLDPMAMRDAVLALAPFMAEAGIDTGDGADRLVADLEALDAELAEMLSAIPADQRKLVTGHGALGYFADRYDLEIVGTVVPGLSSSDEPSARDIAMLVEDIREVGATAVFTDVGTPRSVAEAVAEEADATVVELQVAQLPESGAYADLLRELAIQVADALSSPTG